MKLNLILTKLFFMAAVLVTSVAVAQQEDIPDSTAKTTGRRTTSRPDRSAFEEAEVDYLMAIAINVTGPFSNRMESDDAAFKHVFSLIESFSRDTVGSEARLVITKVGGNDADPLLWEGSPRELRQAFKNPKEFREFILKHRVIGEPHALDSLVKSTEYLLNHEALDNRDCRPALFIVSDTHDVSPFAENFEECAALAKNMSLLAQRRGICGWYFVDQTNLEWATKMVKRAGFTDYRVEAEIVRRPRVPRFN
jgi:hypothetical protein